MLTTEILAIVWRSTLVMTIGLVAARILERRSAVPAHRILTATGLCVLLLPIVCQFGPNWQWRGPDWLAGLEPSAAEEPTTAVFAGAVAAPASQVALPPAAKTRTFAWFGTHGLMSLWIVGSLIMSLRLGVALLRLRLWLSDSDAAPASLAAQAQSMAQALRMKERVRVRLVPGNSMPMVCWFGDWTLVLPADFESWDEDVQRATLSHELGHIARRDVWVDYLNQSLACLWWWHPLALITTRSITRLRELACDEWVLTTGSISPRGYACALLEVVRKCQPDSWQLATPMATKGELENRLRSIHSPNKSQRVRRWTLVVSALAIVAAAGVISVVTFVSDRSPDSSQVALGVFGDDRPPRDLGGSTITGVVTREGQPVSGIKVKLIMIPNGQPMQVHAITSTDEQGRYAIPGLHPGDHYQIEIQSREHHMVRDWQYQSPYVAVFTGAEGETMELPEAKMVSNNQVLKGIVVDPAGKPVAGVSVTANLASGKMLSQVSSSQPPWTQTDEQGGFHLRDLPDEAIELMAYKNNPKGGRIVHPSKQKVELNQQDIRIVFDPRLGTGIEDLDAK